MDMKRADGGDNISLQPFAYIRKAFQQIQKKSENWKSLKSW